MKNIAQIGVGAWGKNILRNLSELDLLHSVYELNPERARVHAAACPGVLLAGSVEEILSSPSIQAVVIATPASTHHDLARRALLAGKDVFVEKPLALRVDEGEDLVRLAGEQGRILMVGHVLRYHPAVLRLQELVVSGELGCIQYVYSNRLNIGTLRTEENILWSFAPHDLSVILSLLGSEPVQVTAAGGDYLSRGVYDTTLTTVSFASGVKGHVFVSWLHPFKEQKLVVVGSRAMAVFDDMSSDKLLLYPHRIEWRDGRLPVAHRAEHTVIPCEPGEPLREELRHFSECLSTRQQPRTDGKEGVRVLRVLEAAERSLAAGGMPVTHGATGGTSGAGRGGIHPTAVVDEGAAVGRGTRIWHFSHVLPGTVIGEDCVIGQNVMIGPDVTTGNRCKIQNNVSLYKGVRLEDEVFLGPSCVFTNVYSPRAFIERKNEFMPTLVRRGATIGANATIVCGVTIGEYAMVGAGAVVKRDVPPHAVVAGVPARQVGWACRCGASIRFVEGSVACGRCGTRYDLRPGEPAELDGGGGRMVASPVAIPATHHRIP